MQNKLPNLGNIIKFRKQDNNIIKCDVTCQNQAFVAEMRCLVMILLRKNVNLAFICYIIYVSMPYQSKVMLIRRSCSTQFMQNHSTEKTEVKS